MLDSQVELTENEEAHLEGLPHLHRLWGVLLCRFCEGVLSEQDYNEMS